VVHVLSEQQVRGAIGAGADGLAHLFLGDSVSADFGKLAAKSSHVPDPNPHDSLLDWQIARSAIVGDPRLNRLSVKNGEAP
jgi:hypothetical protein